MANQPSKLFLSRSWLEMLYYVAYFYLVVVVELSFFILGYFSQLSRNCIDIFVV